MTYWDYRKTHMYYKTVTDLAKVFANEAKSVLDVGCADCEYVLDLKWIPEKLAIDKRNLPKSPLIKGINEDFLTYDFKREFDLVLCLQVLEHLEAPGGFAKRLFRTGKTTIISVPYKWNQGSCKWHVQDPVDENKLLSWTGRKPVYSCVSDTRLISVYQDGLPSITIYLKLVMFTVKLNQPRFYKSLCGIKQKITASRHFCLTGSHMPGIC